jgi:hypothetical protein
MALHPLRNDFSGMSFSGKTFLECPFRNGLLWNGPLRNAQVSPLPTI